MSDVRFEVTPDGTPDRTMASLHGTLDCTSVANIWPQLQHTIQQGRDLEISLAQVGSLNSAALALLLEAKQEAQQAAVTVTFTDLPDSLQNLASMSNVQPLL